MSGLIDRVREERRVRRDFEQLMEANGFGLPRGALRKEKRERASLRGLGFAWWLSRVVVLVVALAVLSTGILILAPLPYDPPAPLQTSTMYDVEGNLFASINAEERRVVVPIRRVPLLVRRAFLAAEDERFYEHSGIDAMAIGRALWNDLTGGRFQGGSTITQQLVRNTSDPYVGRERTLTRKLREAVMAIRLERRFSKDRILEMYLNQIYFGEGAYGVETAAQEYFGKHVWRVTLGEAATLAGLVAAPSRYNPRADLEASRARMVWVLDRMVALGFVPRGEAQEARAASITLAPREPQESQAAYFVDWLTRDIRRRHGADVLYRGGLSIETTLDLRMQHAAERAIAGVLNQPGDPEAALVSIDIRSGGVLAMVGGRDFHRSQVNLATGQGGTGRQAGSAFKPFVLATALEEGISPYDIYSGPSSITIDGHTMGNYGGSSYGSLSVHQATVNSVNTVFAQLIDEVGPADVAETAHSMGIRTELPEVLSLALGTGEVTPLDMTAAYATLASGGIYRRPTGVRWITDSRGEVVERLDAGGRRAIREQTAEQVTDILLDVVAGGTGTGAQIPGVAVAGKTGTAENYVDAWFCGYTIDVATCVWIGYPRGQIPMTSVHGIPVTGGSLPADIWRTFMSTVPQPGASLGTGSGSSGASPAAEGATEEGPSDRPADEGPVEDPAAEEPAPPPEPEQGGGEPEPGIIPDVIPTPPG
ncbi:MAG: transglycosylase domain-containing protein [Actinomycetota bacterium]